MSEIEKMYENAGIEPERQDCCKIADKYWAYNTEKGFEYLMQKECPHNQECTDECEYAYDKVIYQPFTAEKQLELIKWLARKGLIQINYSSHQCYQFNSFRVGGDYKTDISEALASHCNNLWQDLTSEEKQQVKGILE